jgi:hypothetical protein
LSLKKGVADLFMNGQARIAQMRIGIKGWGMVSQCCIGFQVSNIMLVWVERNENR